VLDPLRLGPWLPARPGGEASAWRRRQVRWDPGVRLVVVYESADGSVLRAEARPDGLNVTSAIEDVALPGIASVVRERPDARIVAYKPGSTCVLAAPGSMWKVFRPAELDAVVRHWQAMSVLGAAASVAVPAVDVVDAARGVLAMTVLGGTRLRELAHDPALPLPHRRDRFRSLGAALAALAAAVAPSSPPSGTVAAWAALPARSVAEDGADVLDAIGAMTAVDPRQAGRVAGLVELLTAPGPSDDDRPLVPAHGALRTDQVLVAGSAEGAGPVSPGDPAARIGLVDLDGACRAVPERDLANLTAYLWWRGVRRPADAAEAADLCAAVLDGAAEAGLVVEERRWRQQRALSLLKIATRRYRAVDTGEWPLVPQLVDEAARLVGEGS